MDELSRVEKVFASYSDDEIRNMFREWTDAHDIEFDIDDPGEEFDGYDLRDHVAAFIDVFEEKGKIA